MTPSRTYVLIEKALGEPFEEFIKARRADERSWEYIAREIARRTDVTITRESLRQWFIGADSPDADKGPNPSGPGGAPKPDPVRPKGTPPAIPSVPPGRPPKSESETAA